MTTIKAKASLTPNSQLVNWSYETQDELKNFESLIKVKHCSICYSDVHMIDNDWKASQYPLVPGHEIIGTVEKVGSASNLSPGQTIGIGWQRSSCGKCKFCLSGNENVCSASYPDRTATIVNHHGGFASHVVFDSRFTFPIPSNLSLKETAPLLCGGITVYSGLKSAGMTSGQNIGVIGLGGLGHMAVQFAHKLGNKVTVFSRTEDKSDLAHKLGADNVVITKDGLPKITERFDVILNTVDRPLDWNSYIKILEADGTLCFVGNPGNFELSIDQLLGKRRRVMGSPIGGRYRITEMLEVASKYDIKAMVEEFPLDHVNEAIEKLKRNDIRFRAVLNV
jgi:uncharacterized zinc-type alcohol dehydrogenase-like protein